MKFPIELGCVFFPGKLQRVEVERMEYMEALQEVQDRATQLETRLAAEEAANGELNTELESVRRDLAAALDAADKQMQVRQHC